MCLSDQQWIEYLAKSQRDIVFRALASLRSAQASLQITDQKDLYDEAGKLAEKLELRLKELYKDETIPEPKQPS